MNSGRGFIAAVAIAVALGTAQPRAAQADAAKGEAVYKSQPCSLCHKINGSGGKNGPDLSTVGDRRTAEWLADYLVDPKKIIPKSKMPPAKVTPAELEDLVEYLRSLKTGKSQ